MVYWSVCWFFSPAWIFRPQEGSRLRNMFVKSPLLMGSSSVYPPRGFADVVAEKDAVAVLVKPFERDQVE